MIPAAASELLNKVFRFSSKLPLLAAASLTPRINGAKPPASLSAGSENERFSSSAILVACCEGAMIALIAALT